MLAQENREQTELIQRLIDRVDGLEQDLHSLLDEAAREHARPRGGWFGGLLGPRADSAAQPPLAAIGRQGQR